MTPANTLARTSSRNCSIGATSFRRLDHGGFLSVPHFCVKVKVKCPDSRQKGTVSPVPAPLYPENFLAFFSTHTYTRKQGKEVLAHSPAPGRVGCLVLRNLLPLVIEAAKYDPDRLHPYRGRLFLSLYRLAFPREPKVFERSVSSSSLIGQFIP